MIACREALCLAKDACFNFMTIASDCSGVVRSIQEVSLGENIMIIREVTDMQDSMTRVVFKFEGRSSGHAHSIASNRLI